MIDICCIGHITRDRIITPQTTVNMAGGTSFYMANGMRHLPGKVSFQLVTKVGADQRPVVDQLAADGLNVVCYPSAHTVFFENKYGADSNNRTQRVLAKADPFSLEEVRPLEARVFHLGSLLADDFPPEVVEYLSTKGRISIDVQGYLREVVGQEVRAVDWKDKERILACTDILKLNEHEMEVITSSHDPRTVALQLAASGVREVVITLGSYGSLIYADGRFYEIPSFRPRQLVDATGCGDTYSTGYLWMRMQGADCEEAGRFAAALCTIKLEHSGPFEGTLADVHRVLRRG
jgi:sugar/nucleoside kinase (ribokinase family)